MKEQVLRNDNATKLFSKKREDQSEFLKGRSCINLSRVIFIRKLLSEANQARINWLCII